MQKPIYDSFSLEYKSIFGAIKNGQSVRFSLFVPKEFCCKTPYLIINRDGFQPSLVLMTYDYSEDDRDIFSVDYTANDTGLYFYYFDLYTDYRKIFKGHLGEGYVSWEDGLRYQLTVYDNDFTTPDNLKGGVMYQIFPDRFNEGIKNKEMPFSDRVYRPDKSGEPFFWPTEWHDGYLNMDYYGGDFVGIMEKLPYLKHLGINIIYLNPIFEAHSNHRYNTANYMKADPLLGTNDDFALLCEKAKEHGISIILDGVFSHTGSDSIYFNKEGRYPITGAYHHADSIYRSWFIFHHDYPCGYRSWWGFDTLPEVNEEDPNYRNFICGENGVIDYWLNLGASGFRLDVADELPDDFIEDIRKAVKRCGDDKLLIGEVWEDASTKEAYGVRRTYLMGKGLDSVMNYPFRNAILSYIKDNNAQNAANIIMDICDHYPQPALNTMMNFLSTHDTERIITSLAGAPQENHDRNWQSGRILNQHEYARGQRLVKLSYGLLFFLPGIPSVYYGDEVFMQGYRDPFNRAFYNWECQDTSLKDELTTLSNIRKDNSVFKEGVMSVILANGTDLILQREDDKQKAIIAVNRGNYAKSMEIFGEDIMVPPSDYKIVVVNK